MSQAHPSPPAALSHEELSQRYARALALAAQCGREVARWKDGEETRRLNRELESLRLKCQWQEARIRHLQLPLPLRLLRRLLGWPRDPRS